MLEKLNHIAIVVPDMEKAVDFYRNTLGAKVSESHDLEEHGVSTVFVELAHSKIELLHPLDDNSPVANYLKRNMDGGIHHICLEVADIEQAVIKMKEKNIRVLGDGKAKIGAHGKPVIFLHPKDCFGTLIELEEVY